jgi:DNA-binding NarL/FixJ family response regulator
MNDKVQELFAAAATAPLAEGGWSAWTDTAHRVFDSAGGVFAVVDTQANSIVDLLPTIDGPRAQLGLEEYQSGMFALDPLLPISLRAKRPLIHRSEPKQLCDDGGAEEYGRWQEDRFGFCTNATMLAPLDERLTAVFSTHYPRDRADDSIAVAAVMRQFLPQFTASVQLSFRFNNQLTDAYWDGLQATKDRNAVLLLSERGTIIRCNTVAEQLVRAGVEIAASGNRLQATSPAQDAQLQALIDGAIRRRQPVAGSMRLASSASLTILQSYPVNTPRRLLVADEPAALIVIRRAADLDSDRERWRALFGFTPAECAVAHAARRGMLDDAIASMIGVRLSTVRTHLRSILAKTDTANKAELAHVLTALSLP